MAATIWLGLDLAGAIGGGSDRAAAAATVEVDPSAAAYPVLAAIDSLWQAHDGAGAHALLDRTLPAARSAGDSVLVLRLLTRRGQMLAALGDGRQAEPPLREALGIARTRADTFSTCVAERWLGVALMYQGRRDEGCDAYLRLHALASAARLPLQTAWGDVGVGYCGELAGQYLAARESYTRAIATFRVLNDPLDEIFALNAMGRVASRLGEYTDATRSFQRTETIAQDLGNLFLQALARNNLGTLEWQLGDPGRAQQDFQSAAETFARDGNDRECVNSRLNEVDCLTSLGRVREATSALEEIQTSCDEHGFADLAASARLRRAIVQERAAHSRRAMAILRALLADPGYADVNTRVEAQARLAANLALQDSAEAGLRLLARSPTRNDAKPDVEIVLLRRNIRAQLLLACGRPADALAQARETAADARRLGLLQPELRALVHCADASRALGDDAAALSTLRQARDAWLVERSLPLDPEWREVRGEQARGITTALASLLLDAGDSTSVRTRHRRAFDVVQAFKARTLLERMHGPGADLGADAPITLDELQRNVLRDGELLLDVYLGPTEGLVFAVTRDTCRLVRIPDASSLAERCRRYHEILAGPAQGERSAGDPADAGVLADVAAAMRHDLIDPFADLFAASDVVLFSPDGALNLVPLAAMLDGGPRPDLQRVPSATILAQIRQAECDGGSEVASRTGAATDILAIGSRARPLPGAERELDDLRRFRGCRVVNDAPLAAIGPLFTGPHVVHVAAHATVNDEAPWRSAIDIVGEPGAAAEPLDAAAITHMHVPAQLVVLAGCESAGGRIIDGEGVQGLASAFLCAGAQAVVATLWPVDDRATSIFVHRMYDALARSADASAALAAAQSALRADPRFADPFFWSSFVVVGDGTTSVALRPRARPSLPWLAVPLAVAGAAVWLRRRRQRGRVAVHS